MDLHYLQMMVFHAGYVLSSKISYDLKTRMTQYNNYNLFMGSVQGIKTKVNHLTMCHLFSSSCALENTLSGCIQILKGRGFQRNFHLD